MELTTLSNTALLSTLDSAWTAGNHALAKMLAYLGEVERRGLHLEMACSSMWVFIERRFVLSGGSVHRRLTAARLVRRFPVILSRIEQGDIHLEALCALKDVLTEENVDDLMRRAAKKTLAEVEHIVACLAPRPDVSARVRKLPQKLPQTALPKANAEAPENLFAAAPPRAEHVRPRVEQLAETRHKVQLTVSSEMRRGVTAAAPRGSSSTISFRAHGAAPTTRRICALRAERTIASPQSRHSAKTTWRRASRRRKPRARAHRKHFRSGGSSVPPARPRPDAATMQPMTARQRGPG